MSIHASSLNIVSYTVFCHITILLLVFLCDYMETVNLQVPELFMSNKIQTSHRPKCSRYWYTWYSRKFSIHNEAGWRLDSEKLGFKSRESSGYICCQVKLQSGLVPYHVNISMVWIFCIILSLDWM